MVSHERLLASSTGSNGDVKKLEQGSELIIVWKCTHVSGPQCLIALMDLIDPVSEILIWLVNVKICNLILIGKHSQ